MDNYNPNQNLTTNPNLNNNQTPKKEKSNAFLYVIIIILMIIIIGLLAMLIMKKDLDIKNNSNQNLKSKNINKDNKKVQKKETQKISNLKEICGKETNVCFNYKNDSNWKSEVIVNNKDLTKEEIFNFKNKDNIVLKYSTIFCSKGAGCGVGGLCDNSVTRNVIRMKELKDDNLAVYSVVDKYSSENPQQSSTDKFEAQILITKKINNIKGIGKVNIPVEDWDCIGDILINREKGNYEAVHSKIVKEAALFDTEQEAIDWLNSEENKEVFNILASYHKK